MQKLGARPRQSTAFGPNQPNAQNKSSSRYGQETPERARLIIRTIEALITMMSNEREIPSERQLANILRVVLGPPEDWDEADADYVLEVYEIDPAEAPSRLAQLIRREIESRAQSGEELPAGLNDLHSKLINKQLKTGRLWRPNVES